MSNKQMTAVEWLYEQMFLSPKSIIEYRNILEQAKAMEKEQIENAFENGVDDIIYSRANYEDGEQYYNETYEK